MAGWLDSEDSSDIDNDDVGEATDESEVSRLVMLVESLGDIQNLSLEFDSRYLSLRSEGAAVPVALRSLLPKMKKLTLKMQLNSAFAVSIVSCLLNTCPNLEDLVIGDRHVSDYAYPEAYWDRQMPSDCVRNTLSAVTLYLEYGNHWKYMIELAKFLVNNACVLKNLVIDCCHPLKELCKSDDFQMKLLLLRPASPDAVVELKTGRQGIPS